MSVGNGKYYKRIQNFVHEYACARLINSVSNDAINLIFRHFVVYITSNKMRYSELFQTIGNCKTDGLYLDQVDKNYIQSVTDCCRLSKLSRVKICSGTYRLLIRYRPLSAHKSRTRRKNSVSSLLVTCKGEAGNRVLLSCSVATVN